MLYNAVISNARFEIMHYGACFYMDIDVDYPDYPFQHAIAFPFAANPLSANTPAVSAFRLHKLAEFTLGSDTFGKHFDPSVFNGKKISVVVNKIFVYDGDVIPSAYSIDGFGKAIDGDSKNQLVVRLEEYVTDQYDKLASPEELSHEIHKGLVRNF